MLNGKRLIVFCLIFDFSAVLISGRLCTLKVPTERHPVRVHNHGLQDFLRVTAAGDKAQPWTAAVLSRTEGYARYAPLQVTTLYTTARPNPGTGSQWSDANWIQLPVCHESPRHSVTMQHVADCLHGQRLHSSECGLTTDHNGEASVSPSHGS